MPETTVRKYGTAHCGQVRHPFCSTDLYRFRTSSARTRTQARTLQPENLRSSPALMILYGCGVRVCSEPCTALYMDTLCGNLKPPPQLQDCHHTCEGSCMYFAVVCCYPNILPFSQVRCCRCRTHTHAVTVNQSLNMRAPMRW